jgi:chorismate dehydratase
MDTVIKPPRARIGMVNFINTSPLYEIWKEKSKRPEWLVTEETPANLNRLLFENQLDLGFISSHEYAIHPEKYKILGDISISSSGTVGSVLLLSKIAPEKLDGHSIILSPQSQTSNQLVKIILEDYYQVTPDYIFPEPGRDLNKDSKKTALLVIGDQALKMKNYPGFPHRLDLGEIWHKHTGLPFVFAVWAVREEFCQAEPDCVFDIHHQLLDCLALGQKKLKIISKLIAPRIPMTEKECYLYLKGIEYDLGSEKQEALISFYKKLIKRGEAVPSALPLKICT